MHSAFTTPRGFHTACEHINTIAQDDEVILHALVDVVYHLRTLPNPTAATPTLPPILQSCTTYPQARLESCLNAAQHVMVYAMVNKLQDESFELFLKAKTIFTPQTVQKISQYYTSLISNNVTFETNSATVASKDQHEVTKTIGIEWKIGLMVSSSTCEQIYSPYVSLSIDLASQYESLEMNLSEFAQFSHTIAEIQQAFID